MQRGCLVLPDWKDASTFPNKVFTQAIASFTFPKESLSELFALMQANFSGGEAVCAEPN